MFNIDWAKRSHKGLRRWTLYIVRETPRTGAEIMDMMEAMSQGIWRPSPGSVYPLLEGMTEEGVLSQSPEKRYSLTEKGREEIEGPTAWFGRGASSPRSVDDVLNQLGSYVSYLEDLKVTQSQSVTDNSARIREIGSRLVKLGGS